jgi:hypothetical protein
VGPLFCPRRVLVGTNDGGIHVMRLPVQGTSRIGLFLDRGEDVVPDAGFLPAIEPGRDRGRWTIVRGQVGPGRARAQDPQNAVDDGAVVVARATTLAALRRATGWEQALDALPLAIG